MKGGKNKMNKSVLITLIIVMGVVVLAGFGYLIVSAFLPTTNTITGNGQATVEATPDLVKVYFNVETKGDTSKEAKDENAEIVEDLTITLLQEGFEKKDIQTQNFNIYPEYSWNKGERKLTGYAARHSIIIELSTDESDKIRTVIDAGVDAGAGINYINFELSQEKQNEYKAEAIRRAAEDARIKAEALASGLNKKLGKLISVSDTNFNYYPWRLYEAAAGEVDVAMAKQVATDIQPSEQEISANVVAVFKIK